MDIANARTAFEAFVTRRGGDPDVLVGASAVDAMLAWYVTERANDAGPLEEDGDMLLFQWGTYGRGEDRTFQYDLTRQFVDANDEDDDGSIWQLSVTMHYPPSPETQALESGNCWCGHPDAVDDLSAFIDACTASPFVRRKPPQRLEITFGVAG